MRARITYPQNTTFGHNGTSTTIKNKTMGNFIFSTPRDNTGIPEVFYA